MRVVDLKIGDRTYHLRATMGALRDAKSDGVDIATASTTDPLDMIVLAYHFAKAGATAQGYELKLSLSEFEQDIETTDLGAIAKAFESVMKTDSEKKS